MDLGNKIAYYRKHLNITQETLAQRLGVTNQAVSKWESGQCCPDVMLLPKLADVFGVTLDELFDRDGKSAPVGLPWEDDNTLRVVLYVGHKPVTQGTAAEKITFCYDGEALNIESPVNVECGDVGGNVRAGGAVKCGNVAGSADAGGEIYCGNVGLNANAGGDIYCGNVGMRATAGGNIVCGKVGL